MSRLMQAIRKLLPGVNQTQPRLREVIDIDHERALSDQMLEDRFDSVMKLFDDMADDIRRGKRKPRAAKRAN